jgi:hypothetical protein
VVHGPLLNEVLSCQTLICVFVSCVCALYVPPDKCWWRWCLLMWQGAVDKPKTKKPRVESTDNSDMDAEEVGHASLLFILSCHATLCRGVGSCMVAVHVSCVRVVCVVCNCECLVCVGMGAMYGMYIPCVSSWCLRALSET